MNQIEDDKGWLKMELARFLNYSSLCKEGTPTLVLVMGGVAVGKTRYRRQQYSHGYVVLDAGEIFLNLSKGQHVDFPSVLEDQMQRIGSALAYQALSERRSIVCELIGDQQEATQAMMKAAESVGYKIEMRGLTCDIEVALERNQARSIDNISAHFTQHYHMQWFTEVAARISLENAS